jgi:carboxypeptidase-like protein
MSDGKNIKQYSAADIHNYVAGKLSAAEMHAIEKAALDDPFLADVIEGMENSVKLRGSTSLNADINDLQKRLSARINEKRKTKVIAINRIRWQVAAVLLVLTATGVLTYNYFTKSSFSNKNIAQSELKKPATDSTVIKKDTSIIQSKPQSEANADVVINEKKIEKNQEQKIRRAHARSNDAPKEKIPATFNDEDNAVRIAPVSSPTIDNKRIQSDSSVVFSEAKNRMVAKDIESFNKSNNANEFVGKVVDANSQPISGAYVNIANQKNVTVTDNKGMFRIFAPKSDSIVKINVSSVGFETTKAILSNENDIADNTINLRSNTSSLNEVVVTGLERKRKADTKNIASDETLKNAEPVIGWKKYKEYLDKNKRLSGDSIGLRIIEVVSFTIKKNGKLGNFNIEQSYNDDFDDEAIRLIKTGPGWKLLKNKKARARLTIEF